MKIFCQNISGSTEKTETYDGRPAQGPLRPHRCGWVFYDGQCRSCATAARRGRSLLGSRGFEFVPLQTPWVQRHLTLDPADALEEMKVLTTTGQLFGGAGAILFLARQVWWAVPLSWLGQLPLARHLFDRVYRWTAANRSCRATDGRNGVCSIPPIHQNQTGKGSLTADYADLADSGIAGQRSSPPSGMRSATADKLRPSLHGWLFLIILPLVALVARGHVAPWIFMWMMAGAIFLGCKWLTFRRATHGRHDYSVRRAFGYLFLWAGMDAPNFFENARQPQCARLVGRDSVEPGPALPPARRSLALPSPAARVVGAAILKILFGAVLLFVLARHLTNPLLAGWLGMTGLLFLLHFGLFDLAAIAWRLAGVDARPIMNSPIKATSLAEFWGRRWNGAFNQLVLEIFFVRLARKLGTVRATLTAFLVSGLIHELVISLPAAAGYGLPTGYFLLQGWGIVTQRSPLGKRWRLRRGVRGWLFTMALTAGPAAFLFHPPFVRRVVLPFMQAIGAL